MEGKRQAAVSHYNTMPDNVKWLAVDFFRSMDLDGDARVSRIEFFEFLRQVGYSCVDPNQFFDQLDHNRDGYLDFGEVLTLYFMVRTGGDVCCNVCRALFMNGLYFTCVTCFDHPGDTYDLCVRCYESGAFHHHNHTTFLDSYALLQSKRGAANIEPQSAPQTPDIFIQPPRNKLSVALQVFDRAVAFVIGIGSIASAASACSIM